MNKYERHTNCRMEDTTAEEKRNGMGEGHLGNFCSSGDILFLGLKVIQSQQANDWYLLSPDGGTITAELLF